MARRLLKKIFKTIIAINVLILLYMGLYLTTDRLLTTKLKRSILSTNFTLRHERMGEIGSWSGVFRNQTESNLKGHFASVFRRSLKKSVQCLDRNFRTRIEHHGDFWVLKNFIRASHGELKCHEGVTYTTHADYTFLQNLPVLAGRWEAPISLAVYTPGEDFFVTIECIKYLRKCIPESHLIRFFVTFHLYLPDKHIPSIVHIINNPQINEYNCPRSAPYDVATDKRYRIKKHLLYPVNVGRNIARHAALTHFVLASDIELYPNPGLVEQFIKMFIDTGILAKDGGPVVYALPVFEMEKFVPIPNNKKDLQTLYNNGHVVVFHKKFCKSCQGESMVSEWMQAEESSSLATFRVVKRIDELIHWEPIFIGTHDDPYYDERLSWEGQGEKMTHAYVLCILNYNFHILNNAFLIHKPGIRKNIDLRLTNYSKQYVRNTILVELYKIYGGRFGCQMFEPAKIKSQIAESKGRQGEKVGAVVLLMCSLFLFIS